MKLTTNLNHRDRAIENARSVFSMATLCHYSHAKILDQLSTVRATISHCPQWVRSYYDGYVARLHEDHYRQLEFCYLVDGILYSTHRDSKRQSTDVFYDTGKPCVLNDAPSAHYYKDADKAY